MTQITSKEHTGVPFVCPVCTAENRVNLIALSRAGFTTCQGCSRRLKSQDVARAIHAPRDPNANAPRTWALHR